MNAYLMGLLTLTWTQMKRLLREPFVLGFNFALPLILLVIGGSFINNADISLRAVVLNHANTPFAHEFETMLTEPTAIGILSVREDVASLDEAIALMGRGELESIIELPEGFGDLNEVGYPTGNVVVYYEQSSPQAGQTLSSIMQSILDETNIAITGIVPPLGVEQRPTTTENRSAMDDLYGGLALFTLLSVGVFVLANVLPKDKQLGVLRRFRVTPFRKSQLILGTMLTYSAISMIAVTLVTVAAVLIFDLDIRGDYLLLAVFLLLSAILLTGFGLFVGALAINEDQAAIGAITLAVILFGSMSLPRWVLPEWLQTLTDNLPLAPIVNGIHSIAVEGISLVDLAPQIAIMSVWIVISYAISIRAFRWE
jgi:ABC-2 type transport system permease protein